MAWTVLYEVLKTADFTGSPRVYQSAKLSQSTYLYAVRTWLAVYGQPTATSIQMRVYSNLSGAPDQLLFTSSNSFVISDLIAASNNGAVKEVYFNFDKGLNLVNGETYHFVIWTNGYTGTDNANFGWVRAVPDPVYTTNYTLTFAAMNLAPFKIALIGSELL